MCRRNRPRNLQDRNETISPSPVLQLSPNFFSRPMSTRPITTSRCRDMGRRSFTGVKQKQLFLEGNASKKVIEHWRSRARRAETADKDTRQRLDLF
jgi:hypothetical protein